jgi:hypothetical protein
MNTGNNWFCLISIAKPEEVQQYKLVETKSNFESHLMKNKLRCNEIISLYRILNDSYFIAINLKQKIDDISKKSKIIACVTIGAIKLLHEHSILC